ncbi:hypothetical protein L930_03990 [Helicobacter pylori PZ5004]|nr:hypothetical protein L930_03990 [Helicobacter pylori PZ5004]KAF0999517.1 hypothetical protein HP10700_04446 [Helicobacter pylori 10700]
MIKPCKIPIIGIQSQNQTSPNFNFQSSKDCIKGLNGARFHALMIL